MRLLLSVMSFLFVAAGVSQYFVENNGQWPQQVAMHWDGPRSDVWFEGDRIVFDVIHEQDLLQYSAAHTGNGMPPDRFRHHVYAVEFIGTLNSEVQGLSPRKGYSNFFKGDDPSRWAGRAAHYDELSYPSLYEGIELRWRMDMGRLKYDLIVAPDHDPALIRFRYDGLDISKSYLGELVLHSAVGELIEARPIAYQIIHGERRIVPCEYVVEGRELGFELGDYDHALPLIIDPVLVFSSYSGSGTNNFGYTATYDNDGFLYSGSTAFGNEYPNTLGAYDEDFNGGDVDIAISKWDTTGTQLIWSSYLGGSGGELPHSIIVNDQDELYVYGTSGSGNFPTTAGAYDGSFGGGTDLPLFGLGLTYPQGCDIVVSKLAFDGSELLASTFVGGSSNDGINFTAATRYNYADEIRGEIELDAEGRPVIVSSSYTTTGSNDFPTTTGSLQAAFSGGVQDGLLFRMDTELSELQWSSFLGGSGADAAFSLALRSDGQVVVTGGTASDDLLTSDDAVQLEYAGDTDSWVAVIDIDQNILSRSSYLGTSTYDQAYFVELDAADEVHLFGQTFDGDAFIQNADYSVANSGQFITQLNADLSDIVWSTAFGNGDGMPNISPTAFLVDICDRIYLSGWGGPVQVSEMTTTGLPVTNDAFQTTTDGGDFYLMSIADDASELLYGSFFGGNQSNEHVDGGTSRFDRKGKVYQAVCAGCQNNDDFPTSPSNVVSTVNGSGGCNLGVFKMDFDLPAVIADFVSPQVCLPDTIEFINNGVGGTSFQWNFGDGEGSSLENPSHVYTAPGAYTVTLIANDPFSCNLADTLSQQIFVFGALDITLDSLQVCAGESLDIGLAPLPLPGISYQWNNTGLLDNASVADPTATLTESTLFNLSIDNGVCPSMAQQFVEVLNIALTADEDTTICAGTEITLTANSLGQADSFIWSDDPDFANPLSNDSTLLVNGLFSDTYYVQASNECSAVETVNVQVAADFIQVAPGPLVCADELIALNVFSSNGGAIDAQWTPNELIVDGQGTGNVTVMSDASAWFQVDFEDEFGCSYEDSIFVEISPLSFVDVIASTSLSNIPIGGSTELSVVPSQGYQFQWSPPNGLSNSSIPNPTASPTETTTYTVEIIDSGIVGECLRSDTVTIRVFEFLCDDPVIFVPNAFTPNEDGENDVLFVRGNYIEAMQFTIYDRWGNIVFETDDQEVGWDGRYRGTALDPAVYVYHLDVKCIDGQENFLKGNITLIR